MRKIEKIKMLNKAIFDHVVSAIVFTLILIASTTIITRKFIESNILNTYSDKGFTIQINPKIKNNLESLSDIEGLNLKSNVINITNNNTEDKTYQVILTPINDDEKDIRLAIDNYLLRNLDNFDKIDNSYLIIEYKLPSGMTNSHTIRMWQDKKVENKKINVDFNLEIKIID